MLSRIRDSLGKVRREETETRFHAVSDLVPRVVIYEQSRLIAKPRALNERDFDGAVALINTRDSVAQSASL